MKNQIFDVLTAQTASNGQLSRFPANPRFHEIFVEAASTLVQRVSEEDPNAIKSQTDLTNTIVKFAQHWRKRGWHARHEIERDFSKIVDAICGHADKLGETLVTLTRLLDPVEMRLTPSDANNVRAIAYSDDERFLLVEVLSPQQLGAETGKLFHSAKSWAKYYGDDLLKNRQRFFSLRSAANGQSCVIVRYNSEDERITEIHGKTKKIRSDEDYFIPLCQTLFELGKRLPIRLIDGLPDKFRNLVMTDNGEWEQWTAASNARTLAESIAVTDRTSKGLPDKFYNLVMTYDGLWEPWTAASNARILTGTIAVTDKTSQKKLNLLAANQRLTLDISALKNTHRLPPRISASLHWNNKEALNLEHVVLVNDVVAPKAAGVRIDNLEQGRDIYVLNAANFIAPKLKTVGRVNACRARNVKLPALTQAGALWIGAANMVDLNSLCSHQTSKQLLQYPGIIQADRADSYNGPLGPSVYLYYKTRERREEVIRASL